MILSPLPLRRIPKVPIGLMLPDGNIVDETGAVFSAARTAAKVVYASSPMYPLRVAKRIGGKGFLIGNRSTKRWTRFDFPGFSVFPGVESPSLEGLIALRDASYAEGISAASLQKMAFFLCRSTLPGFVKIAENESDIPLGELPLGARLYDRPGVYKSLASYDIRGAYLWGISTLPVPATLSRVRRIRPEELCSERVGFVRATVWLKAFPVGPIPVLQDGRTIFPEKPERVRVFLTLDDFRLSRELGIRSSIEEAWIGGNISYPFSAFGSLMGEWRTDPVMGGMAKQMANTLWGSFGSSGSLYEAKISPHSPRIRTTKLPDRKPRSLTIAGSVIGRLRAKVYREGIGSATVHVHTDGLMTTDPGIVTGSDVGDWRFTGERREVEILAPGWYAFDAPDGRIYKTAGRALTQKSAQRLFARKREQLERDGIIGKPPERQKEIFA